MLSMFQARLSSRGGAARAPGGGHGGVLGGEDDDAHALASVGAAQPLAADEAGLALGPPEDVLAKAAGHLAGA